MGFENLMGSIPVLAAGFTRNPETVMQTIEMSRLGRQDAQEAKRREFGRIAWNNGNPTKESITEGFEASGVHFDEGLKIVGNIMKYMADAFAINKAGEKPYHRTDPKSGRVISANMDPKDAGDEWTYGEAGAVPKAEWVTDGFGGVKSVPSVPGVELENGYRPISMYENAESRSHDAGMLEKNQEWKSKENAKGMAHDAGMQNARLDRMDADREDRQMHNISTSMASAYNAGTSGANTDANPETKSELEVRLIKEFAENGTLSEESARAWSRLHPDGLNLKDAISMITKNPMAIQLSEMEIVNRAHELVKNFNKMTGTGGTKTVDPLGIR